MTAPSKLTEQDIEFNGRGLKGLNPAVSAAVAIQTTYTDIITYTGGVLAANGGAWLDVGNAAGLVVVGLWTHKTTPAIVTVLPCFSPMNPKDGDPTIYAPAPSIVASDIASGVATTYPQQAAFSKNNWTTDLSPGSDSNIKKFMFYVESKTRLVKFMSKADDVTSAPTLQLYVIAGTNN